MDVTTSNFGKIKAQIESLLLDAQYIAFDLEFTGLDFEKFQRDRINYLPYEKYKKLKYVAQTYQILQLGISIIGIDKTNGKLKIYPFNFYLFPRNPVAYDKNLTMQLSCVKFNSDHGMDWNKWIREGVNFVRLAQMGNLLEAQKNKTLDDILGSLSPENQEIAKDFIRLIQKVSKQADNTSLTFDLPKYQSVQKILNNIFYKFIKEQKLNLSITTGQDCLIIKKIDKKGRSDIEEKILIDTYGFALIFKSIWAKQIPFIGHNCALDILYLYHNFVDQLPEDYFEFKNNLMKTGNSFYDTKYIAGTIPELLEKGTRLEDLVKSIKEISKIKLTQFSFDPEFNRYNMQNQILHEAGYDSYITAWVYQQMLKLNDNIDKQCKNILNLHKSFFSINLATFQDEVNKHFAHNILRINIPIEDKEDVWTRRKEQVKFLKSKLQNCKGAYQIHEGYREIFLQIKDNRKKVLLQLLQLVNSGKIKEINTLPTYLAWQKERVAKETKKEFVRYDRSNNRPYEKKQTKEKGESSSAESSENSQTFKKNKDK